jgi:hypothetical protein
LHPHVNVTETSEWAYRTPIEKLRRGAVQVYTMAVALADAGLVNNIAFPEPSLQVKHAVLYSISANIYNHHR